MLYLRVTATDLAPEARRELVASLAETTLDVVKPPGAEHLAMHYDVVDADTNFVRVELRAPLLPMRARRRLVQQYTRLLAAAFGLEGNDVYRIGVHFVTYDPKRDVAIGGRFVDEVLPRRSRALQIALPLLVLAAAAIALKRLV